MSVAGILSAGRALAESLMTDTCTVRHGTGQSSFNESTGQSTLGSAVVYAGKCRVQVPKVQPNEPTVGERTATVQSLELQLPVSAAGVSVGDRVTLDSSASDPALAGARYVVRGLHRKTHATAQRLSVEETTA